MLGRIRKVEPRFRSKLPALFNDALIAISANQIGATVYTKDKEDFKLLRRYQKFELELFTD